MNKISFPSEYRQAFDEIGLYVPDIGGDDRVAANKKIRWQAVFFMGPAGAGKSFIRGKKYMKHVGFRLVDVDEIKKRHKDYDPERPFEVHEWSKKVSEVEFKEIVTSGRGDAIIMDGTGRDAIGIKKKIILADNNGYRTFLIYVTVPIEISLFRNRNRKRHVPENILMTAYHKIKKSFTALKGLVDKFKVIMNYESKEMKIAIPDMEMYPPPQSKRPPRHKSFRLEVDSDPNYGKEKVAVASDVREIFESGKELTLMNTDDVLKVLDVAKTLIAKKLRLKTVMEQGKKTRQQQEREKNKYVSQVGPWLGKLLRPNSKAMKIVDDLVDEFPGRNSGSTLTKRKNQWIKRAKMIPEIIEFTEYIGGTKRMYGAALYIVRDVALGQIKLGDGKEKARKMANQWFVEKSISGAADVFEEGGYETEFRDFLPPNISFDLGPTREVIQIVEIFGREKKNWETMAKKLAFIAESFNDIVQVVKKDLRSGNEVVRLCALMTAITIETGLRPGEIGNAATVKDPDTGEEIKIETFGITTLQARHVKFIRDNFIELRFIGKSGTENVAHLSDADVLKALQGSLESTSLNGDTAMLFVTKSGEHVGYKELNEYVSEKWGDITPTDFRKLKATQTFYDSLKEKVRGMKTNLSQAMVAGARNIKKKVVGEILKVLESAVKDAQEKLSHEDWKTTVRSYVDPRIIVNFLNRGGLNDALEDILVKNKNVSLTFDFNSFLSQAKVAVPVVVFQEKGSGLNSPAQMMEELDDLIENLTG